ncbi:hypothetical protein K439DRAFT_770893 [Ramaria rubella]|nr:hypothetical protein K439DRAFT_770893 [Ramaria rubella]
MLTTLTTYNNHSTRVILCHAHVLVVPHCPSHAQPRSPLQTPTIPLQRDLAAFRRATQAAAAAVRRAVMQG